VDLGCRRWVDLLKLARERSSVLARDAVIGVADHSGRRRYTGR